MPVDVISFRPMKHVGRGTTINQLRPPTQPGLVGGPFPSSNVMYDSLFCLVLILVRKKKKGAGYRSPNKRLLPGWA